MYKTYQLLLVLLTGIAFTAVVMLNTVYAQPTVTLAMEPDIHEIHIGSEINKEIKIIAVTDKKDFRFKWHLDGPGKFAGNKTSPGIYYISPAKIDKKSAKAIVTVIVTDGSGEKASERVVFILIAPPQSNPQEFKISQLLETADNYFNKNYMTTPKETNAFDIYKEVLERYPTNPHARKQIHEIAEFYKYVGDRDYEALKKDPYTQNNTKKFYQRYLKVTRYILNTLKDSSIAAEFQEIQKRLRELENPLFLLEKSVEELQQTYKQLKEREQQGDNVNKQIISVISDIARALRGAEKTASSLQVEQLLKSADAYFKNNYFTTPAKEKTFEENAFDRYKNVLELDSVNRDALDRIYEIASTYRTWEDNAAQDRNDIQAKMYRKQYQLIVEDLLGLLDDQFSREYVKLTTAKEKGDRKEEIIRTLRIIGILRELKKIYEQFSQGDVETKQILKRTEDVIHKYEQELFRE